MGKCGKLPDDYLEFYARPNFCDTLGIKSILSDMPDEHGEASGIICMKREAHGASVGHAVQ